MRTKGAERIEQTMRAQQMQVEEERSKPDIWANLHVLTIHAQRVDSLLTQKE